VAQLSQPPELSLGSGTQLPDLELARIEELLKSAPEKDLAGSVEETSAGDAMARLEAEATQAGEEAPEIPSAVDRRAGRCECCAQQDPGTPSEVAVSGPD